MSEGEPAATPLPAGSPAYFPDGRYQHGRHSNAHAFTGGGAHHFGSGSTDARECFVREKGAIAYVTVNRLRVLNALNRPTWKDLTAFLEKRAPQFHGR